MTTPQEDASTITAVLTVLAIVLLIGIAIGHWGWGASRVDVRVKNIEVDVIANTEKCKKMGGELLGRRIERVDGGFLMYDAYEFKCVSPEKELFSL